MGMHMNAYREHRCRAGLALLTAALLLCLACALPAQAWAEPSVGEGQAVTGNGTATAETTVSVYVDALRIVGKTPDLAGSAAELMGGPQELRASVAGGAAPYSSTWTRTVDGAFDPAFSQADELVDASVPAVHAFAPGELAEGRDYVYTLSITDAVGEEVAVEMRVLCSADYGWRDGADADEPKLLYRDEATGAEIKVAGYLHQSVHIEVTPLDEFDPARLALLQQAGGAIISGAWVIEIVFEGAVPAGVPAYVGDIAVSVRFPGALARVALPAASVEGRNALVRVGDVWSFPEAVLFMGPDAGIARPECAVDDEREWLSFSTEVLGAFATLAKSGPGATHKAELNLSGAGQVVPAAGEGGSYAVADGGTLSFTLVPDAGWTIGEVSATGGTGVSLEGNRLSVGPVQADCTVSVAFERVEPDPSVLYQLEAQVVGGGGSVEPDGPVQVARGESALVRFLPDAGYVVDEVRVNGARTTVFADTYLIPAMTEDMHVEVSFKPGIPAPQTWFTARAEVVSGQGEVSPAAALAPLGGQATFSFMPAEGWKVADVTVDGTSVGAPSSYAVKNVTADALVQVRFEEDGPGGSDDPDPQAYHVVTASAGAHGNISPAGEVKVADGADASFAFVPDEGYRVAGVTVDGKGVGAPASYVLESVAADRSIHVEFAPLSSGGGSGTAGGGGGAGSGGIAGALSQTGDVLAGPAGAFAMVALAAILAAVSALVFGHPHARRSGHLRKRGR